MFDQSKIDQLGTFSGQTSLLLQTPMLSTNGLSGSMMLDKNFDIVGVFSAGITYIEEGRNYGDRLRKPAFQIIPKSIASEIYDQAIPLLTWYQKKESESYVNYFKALEYVLTPATNNTRGELDIIATKENYLNLAKNNYSEEVLPPELIAEFIHLHVSKYIFQRVQFRKKEVQELAKALEYAEIGIEHYPHIAKFWEQAGQIYHYSEIENLNLHSYANDKNRCYAYGKAYQIETSNPIYKKTLQNFKCK